MLKLEADPTLTRVQTRDGREAKILEVFAYPNGKKKIFGRVFGNGEWESRSWDYDGILVPSCNPSGDLVNVPEKRLLDVWINVYADGGLSPAWRTKELAEQSKAPNREACLHITREYTVGEGLE
jgi:hypothetical protein